MMCAGYMSLHIMQKAEISQRPGKNVAYSIGLQNGFQKLTLQTQLLSLQAKGF